MIFTDTSKKFIVHFCVVCNMIFYAIFHAFFFYFSVLFFSIEKVRGWYNFCKAFSTCQHFYLQLGNWLKYNVIARCAQKELPDFFVHKLLHSIFRTHVNLDRKKMFLHLKVKIDIIKDKQTQILNSQYMKITLNFINFAGIISIREFLAP